MKRLPEPEASGIGKALSSGKVACARTSPVVLASVLTLCVGCMNATSKGLQYDREDMVEFPSRLLVPTSAVLSGSPGEHSIEIYLDEFELDGETIDTSFRFDWIDGLPASLNDCVGRRFVFPMNPDDGYVDGSIYLVHAHHPAHLTRLSFEERGGRVFARFEIQVQFSFEGLQDASGAEYGDFDMNIRVPIAQE